MSVIDNTDKGLRVYYNSFPNTTYTNADNVGKFKAFCNDNYENDNEELQKDLDNNEYTLTTFDIDDEDDDATNDFPLNSDISDQDQREKEIFNIIKYCSIHGEPPKDKLYRKPYDYTPFNIDNNEQKYNYSLFQFTDNTFCHILEEYEQWKLTQSQRIQFPSKKRWRGNILILNEKQKKQKDYHNIEIKINDTLHELIVLSKPFKQTKKYEQNTLFHRDFTSLLLDAYHRYCIITEIMHMDIENTIQKHIFTYSQLYWQVTRRQRNTGIFAHNNATNRITTFRLISNQLQSELDEKYKNKLKESKNGKTITATLVINGKIISNCCKNNNNAIKDYNNIIFKFMTSHKFYWCLAEQKKNITFFKSAFKTYKDAICGPLTLKNMNKMHDNIFVFWMYIWSMSNIVKTYMQSGDICIPLQIDLVIISADNNNKNIDNISERFNIHNQKFETVLCDPTNIDSIRQKLERIFMKYSIKMKKKGRIVIIVDRRSRYEYFKDKNFDRIYGYKPLMKYCQIDKKYEIINAIWNTSTYLLPQCVSTHGKIKNIGAKNMRDLFVFTYFIRKKSQFSAVFNYKQEKEEKQNNDNNNIPVTGTHIQQISSNTAQFDDSTIAESIAESFTTVDTLDVVRPQPFKTKKAQEMFQKMSSLHQKNQLTSVKLHELLQQVQAELAGVVNPMVNTKLNSRKKRAMTVTNLQVVSDFQTLQSHIIQVAMARKLDSVVNMYVFYNGGYFRFEPWDLIRILPQLFHVNRINNFDNMINDFKKYHDKLWELDDEIWMKYNEIYLKSMHCIKQKVNTEELGTDPNDRNIIKNYCKWDKKHIGIHDEDIKHNDIEMKYDNNINIIKNYENVKEIELKCALNEFIEWKSKGGEKGVKASIGMIIKRIVNNDYKQLLNLDNKLWSIMCIKYDNKIVNVSEKKNTEIDKLLADIYKHKIYPYIIELIGGFFKICDGTENKIDERVIELSLKLSEFLEWIDNSTSSKIRDLAKDTSKEIAMNLKQLHKKKGNGFKISNINNNEYGIAFKETGVFAGWYIKQVNNKDVSRMDKWEFELFLNNIYNDINVKKLKKYRIKFIYPDRTLSIVAYKSKKKMDM
eukprot:259464_1